MNPRLARLVASQFEQMQGLRTAAWGFTLLLLGLVNTLPRQDVIDSVVREVLWLLPFAFLMWATHAIPAFYARRFGRVVRNSLWDRPDVRFMVWQLAAVMLLAAHVQSAILWFVWTAYPLYLVFSGWPYRLQHLLTAAAGVYATSAYLSGTERLPHAEPGFDSGAVAVAMIVAGLIDHLVLARALSPSTGALHATDDA